MPPIIAIRFHSSGRQYHFDAQGHSDLQPGDRVVVETARGRQLGIVIGYVPEDELEGRTCKPIERPATPRDLVMLRQWQTRELNALVTCREQAEQIGLSGIKFVAAEYNFDGSQVTILYVTERKRVELGGLQRELRRTLRTQVELFQIGPRDSAKYLDGLGACGVQRCCSRFLTKFNSVSIRMAKLQNISLTPSEITGVCGRLRCCLAYEHELYAELSEGLPRRGKEIVTPHGKGKAIEIRTLSGEIVVDVEGVRHTIQREDVGKTEFSQPPAPVDLGLDWLEDEPIRETDVEKAESAPAGRPSERRERPTQERRRPQPTRGREGRTGRPAADHGDRSRPSSQRRSRRKRPRSDKGR